MSIHGTPDGLVLSPSSAGRWTKCPASAVLARGVPSESSVFAEAGSAGHAVAECLWKGQYSELPAKLAVFEKHPDWPLDVEGALMAANRWIEEVNGLRPAGVPWTVEASELPLADDAVWPGFHGTADFAGRFDTNRPVWVISDLKLGRGVPVAAEENLQLALYAKMFLDQVPHDPDDRLILQIGQVLRKDGVSTWELTAHKLARFYEARIAPALEDLKRVLKVDEPYGHPGPWCRWCPVLDTCRAVADERAHLTMRTPGLMTPDELAAAIRALPRIKNWLAKFEDTARERVRDHIVPGWTLAPGSSREVLSDPDAVVERLREAGYDDGEFLDHRLVGVPKLRRLLGDDFDEVLGPVMERKQNRPKLVEEKDRIVELFGDTEKEDT